MQHTAFPHIKRDRVRWRSQPINLPVTVLLLSFFFGRQSTCSSANSPVYWDDSTRINTLFTVSTHHLSNAAVFSFY